MDDSTAGARPHYLFLDEGGNLDFSPRGSRYYTMTAVSKRRPFVIGPRLDSLKFDILEHGIDLEYFHCTTDKQTVRNRVFEALTQTKAHCRVDCLVIEKAKTEPALQQPDEFYPRMMGYLVRHALRHCWDSSVSEVIVITDNLPNTSKGKSPVMKAIKTTLRHELPPAHQNFRVLHFASKSLYGLQVADYYNWAVFRKWESGDTRSYDLIDGNLSSELDIFRGGTRYY